MRTLPDPGANLRRQEQVQLLYKSDRVVFHPYENEDDAYRARGYICRFSL